MKVLVTGREGQVARSLAERSSNFEFVFTGRDELDLTQPASIERGIARLNPDIVVSAAAYTAVDRAESEVELAMTVNGIAPGVIGRAARQINAAVIHLSTDYVFDGSLEHPLRESDPVAPLGVYGASKLLGEQSLAESGVCHAIVRTSWVYSPFGSNFVKTMLRLAQSRDEVSVVSDQVGCPTSAHDVAEALFAVMKGWRYDAMIGCSGLYHFAGSGETAWDGFAREIFAASQHFGGPAAHVRSISAAEYPTAAARPANSRLDSSHFTATFGYRAPDWRDSLARVVERLVGGSRC